MLGLLWEQLRRKRIREYVDRRHDSIVLIEYQDKRERNYKNYKDFEGFDNTVSSVAWHLPPDWNYLMFRHPEYKGTMLSLTGGGPPASLDSLKKLGLDNRISSSKFIKATIEEMNAGWIELYEHPKMEGRRLTIRGVSSNAQISNYEDITVERKKGFNDKISSIRYQLPKGTVYRLYTHDNYKRPYFDLVGTGQVKENPDLFIERFHDRVSSSRYLDL